MKTRELKQHEWKDFCRQLNEKHKGGMVTVQLLQSDGSADPVMKDMPLQSVVLKENPDECNNTMVIEAGLPNERPRQHLIVEPVRLILRNGSGDRFNELDVIAESGTTLLILHPGINPASLDGLGTRPTV
jgi:hypothetical protein